MFKKYRQNYVQFFDWNILDINYTFIINNDIYDIYAYLKKNKVDFIYTNPNKSKIYLGKSFIDSFPNLKCVCTASTGTTHIDKKYLEILFPRS